MKLLQPLAFVLSILSARTLATENAPKVKHDYQVNWSILAGLRFVNTSSTE
jgi:hypothetical protein